MDLYTNLLKFTIDELANLAIFYYQELEDAELERIRQASEDQSYYG